MFQLVTNYRSPGRVIDCAHSIIELLKSFPKAVDELDRERGIVEGAPPVFVTIPDSAGEAKFWDLHKYASFTTRLTISNVDQRPFAPSTGSRPMLTYSLCSYDLGLIFC